MLFEVSGVNKSFGGKKVIEGVNLSVQKGEIHGLVGKNGAGKSTLVNIITGLYSSDSGELIFEGNDIGNMTVLERQRLGIFIVPQHASITPDFTVAENLFTGVWPKNKFGIVDWKSIHKQAIRELKEYGLDMDSSTLVRDLSLIQQRKLNIVKALFSKAKLIILDEPTTALSELERDSMFEFINNLRNQGKSFIFISHYSEEIIALSDKITVLRDGKSFTGYSKGELDEKQLLKLINGEDIKLSERNVPSDRAVVDLLSCKSIYGEGINGVELRVAKGEILGLVGFPGSGSREICRTLAGLNPAREGEINLNGKQIPVPRSPEEALKQGIVYISYDRHHEGIIKNLTIRENTSLSILKSKLRKRFGVVDTRREIQNADHYFKILNVKANSIGEQVGDLSGGNQQKVVIAKALSSDPQLLILDEPTVGIDVKSREEILDILNVLTVQHGLSILYFTNDYDELCRISDRIVFFQEGKVVTEVVNDRLTSEKIIRLRDVGEEEAV